SGTNIHENRGNALKLVVRALQAAIEAGVELELGGVDGGSKYNAIPREAEARLFLAPAALEPLRAVLARIEQDFHSELRGIDEGLKIELAPAEAASGALARGDRDRLLGLLAVLPHGVAGMSPAIPGLVETSNNLAAVHEEHGRTHVVVSSRSSVLPTMQAVLAALRAAGRLSGAEVETHDGYPGWKPNLESPVLKLVRDVYRERWGREPEVTAIHAGLECGLLGERIAGCDMISFGPQIEGAHSPDERVHVPSVERFWGALREVLVRLS
ncbi:MAG TPA: M20/M25/M40 family metallo-hydrolase, partial [Candidatus Polarisedimenticolaceae bacterium]|nr:M20/M25/M40 family metallo-hydrolase [Candidatus Polarisedimenticolaceae bacterium]